MSSLDSIIKFNKEESNINEENKVNFEIIEKSGLKTLNQQIMASSFNGIGNNSFNNSINFDDSLNKNISIYNNLNKKEEEKVNEKKEEENNNNIDKKVGDIKDIKFNDNNIGINDIITNESYNNTIHQDFKEPEVNDDQEKEINKEENIKDDDYYRDRTYSFKPKKLPGTPNLCQKEQKVINEFNLDNDKNQKNSETQEIVDNFTETIQTKIESNENNLPSIKEQITKKQDNLNINNINININSNSNREQSFDEDKNEQNNDESEDNTYKEEEDFLEKEELKRKKKETNNDIINNLIINKEIKNVDIIEEKKDEEEEDNEDYINAMIKEEAQKKYLEEQDKKKNLQNVRNEMEIRKMALKESVEQKKKKLLEMVNQNKKEKEKNNDKDNKENIKDKVKKETKENIEIKEKEKIVVKNNKKENKNEINNNEKYGDKINAKKKQLSNTVFNRLYYNRKRKEKEKEKINEEINQINQKNNKNKTNKNKNSLNEISYRTNNNKLDTFIINETENKAEENNHKKIKSSGNFPMISDLKKESNNKPSKIHKKQNAGKNLYNSNSFIQNFIKETKNSEKSKKLEQFKQPIIFDDSEYETYSFKPEINQKSINLCKKKFNKRKNSSPLNKTMDMSDKYIENRRLNTPIGELLYEDAFNQRQKMENLTLKHKKEIKKDGNKSLISKGSESLLFKKNELKLKEIIDRYSQKNKGELSIVGVIQCLWEMHILRELLQNSSKTLNEIDLEYLKTKVDEIMRRKSKGTRHYEEIEFVEQLWIKINPYYKNEKDFIDKDSLFQFLKILFSFNEQIEMNKMISKVDNFLKIINKKEDSKKEENLPENKENNINEKDNNNENIKENDENNNNINNINNGNNIENNKDIKDNDGNNEDKNQNNENKEINNDKENNIINENNINSGNKENNANNKNNINKVKKEKTYNSLLRNKELGKNDIWHLSKFIRAFFELKKLISNYQTSKKDKIMENIIKEREKDLTFQPDFNATSSYFHSKNLKDKKEDSLNISINSNLTTNSNTNKKKRDFNKLYQEFMLKKQMHEKALRILRENKEKREIRMCTDRPSINRNYKIKNRKKTPEVGCTRNEFLYNLNKDI